MGLRFELAEETHHSWVRLTVDSGALWAYVKDYAFNMVPDASIPTSTSLAALVELFGDGFEGGNTSDWSTTVP